MTDPPTEGPVSLGPRSLPPPGMTLPAPPPGSLYTRVPGLWVLRHYRAAYLRDDVVAGLVLTALLGWRTDLRTTGTVLFADPGWDRHLYRAMASETPLDFHLAPYCWRVLVPAVAGISPFGQQATFMATSFAAVAAAGTAWHSQSDRIRL